MTNGIGYGLGKKPKKDPDEGRNWFVDSVVKFFASGCYVGYIPVIPGTAGAALGVLVYRSMIVKMRLHPLQLFFVYLGYFLLGVFITSLARKVFNEGEVNIIVFDKILGGMISVSAFPVDAFQEHPGRIFVAFLIFRLWEIAKLFPLKPLEKLPRGLGVMADDVGGGIITLFIVAYMPEWMWPYLTLQGVTSTP